MKDLPNQPSRPAPPTSGNGLGTPQFDLRTLMLMVSSIAVVLAVHVRFGALAASIVTLGALAVAAHVAANAIGTKLRDHRGDEISRRQSPRDPRRATPLDQRDFAPTTRLGARTPQINWTAIIITLVGSAVATAGGAALFAVILGPEARWNLLLVGGLAFGVLGGIATFGAFSFMRVSTAALHQAVRDKNGPSDL